MSISDPPQHVQYVCVYVCVCVVIIWYLVIFLEYSMHFGHLFAHDGLDDVHAVVRRHEPGAAAARRVRVHWRHLGQRVLKQVRKRCSSTLSPRVNSGGEKPGTQLLRTHHEHFVVDVESLAQVSEHHGAVLFELEVTRHVLPANEIVSEASRTRP